MATEVETPQPTRKYEFRSKPTQAKPSHTLFGSCMEIYTKKERDEINSIDIDNSSIDEQPKLRVRNMPAALSVKIPGRAIVLKSPIFYGIPALLK